ncbi:MAG: helix-turn-helix domain-containing protein, partial [Prevotella sp.]|nr:helix-turn-helix domain-containing protein [Prevotella sp.]
DYARQLLKEHPGMSINEVGTRCGYTDQAYFSRSFSRIVGISPRQYRKNINKEQTDATS